MATLGAITIVAIAYLGHLFARLLVGRDRKGNQIEAMVGVVGIVICLAAVASVLIKMSPKQSMCEIERKVSHSNRQCF
ncbi:hypothetical protein A9174_19695 [Mesorhizobium loti NZP2037]|nr:hypothetical protein A9174_19695 [Mesorhizobium loti NZP2037]